MSPTHSTQLLDSQILQSLIQRLDHGWGKGALAQCVRELPPDPHLHALWLGELVKVDLCRHWEMGLNKPVETYLADYPDLGTPDTVSLGLIEAELHARLSAGDDDAWRDLVGRFPGQLAPALAVLRDFDRGWDESRLAERVARLPQEGPVRVAQLRELIKLDLRLQWERGDRRTLDSYLFCYPELGTAETVSPDLVKAELEARQRVGDEGAWPVVAGRFPKQMTTLQRRGQHTAPHRQDGPANDRTLRGHPVNLKGDDKDPAHSTIPPEMPTTAGVPMAGSEPALNPSTVSAPPKFQRYQILKELGRGAMGTVYLVQDTKLKRRVAMKVPHFRPGDGPETLARFYREASSAATLDNPNICPVYDVGENASIPYLTMAFIEGSPLTDRIKGSWDPEPQTGSYTLDPQWSARIVSKLARALQEAHSHSIIHRDLKPSNVMMNQRGEPIIMDFGLARKIDSDIALTQQGSVLGTPAYMSPEQVRGESQNIGVGTDIYSLGIILYELLCGQVPFRGSLGYVMAMILNNAPRRPIDLRPDLDPGLEAICLKAMAKDVKDRFASMTEFADALDAYLAGTGAAAVGAFTTVSAPAPVTTPGGPGSTPTVVTSVTATQPQVEEPTSPSGQEPGPVPANPFVSGKLLAAALGLGLLLGLGYAGYKMFFVTESVEAFLLRIQGIAAGGQLDDALRQIQEADQADAVKARALKEVRDRVLPWADQRLKDRQAPAEVSAVLATLLQRFPTDADVAQRQVAALVAERRFKPALDVLGQPTFAKAQWSVIEKHRILKDWADSAARQFEEGKFLEAKQTADAVLAMDRDQFVALDFQKKAADRIDDVTRRVEQALKKDQFEAACDALEKAWPRDERGFKVQIYTQWHAAVKKLADEGKLIEAEERLAELVKRFPQNRTDTDRLGALIQEKGQGVAFETQKLNQAIGLLKVRADFTKSRQGLEELQARIVEPMKRQQFDAFLQLVKEGEDCAKDPLKANLDALATRVSDSKDRISADARAALEKAVGRLFERRVELSVPTVADVGQWKQVLKDCDRARDTRSTWVLACRLECLAGLKGTADGNDAAWDEARKNLENHIPNDGAKVYAEYALALSKPPQEAAPLLRQVFDKDTLAAVLQSPARKRRAAEILTASAADLRLSGTFAEPFGSQEAADAAFQALVLAGKLGSKAVTGAPRENLALAAWYKTKRDKDLAGKLIGDVLADQALDQKAEEDKYRLRMIHARTRPDDADGQKAALDSLLAALPHVRAVLQVDPRDNPKRFENVALPVCEDYYAHVIRPLRDEKAPGQLVTAQADADLRDRAARLAAGTARLIKENATPWVEVKGLDKGTLRGVIDLYDRAFRLAPANEAKAEYLVLKAYTYQGLPKKLAEILKVLKADAAKAIDLAPKYAGGYGLSGTAQLLESRTTANLAVRMKLLQGANTRLTEALDLAAKDGAAKGDELSGLLRHSRGVAGMELANYVGGRPAKAKYLRQAEQDIERVVALSPRDPLVLDAYGCILEDIGLYLGDPETYYSKACDQFERAKDFKTLTVLGRAKPYLDYGRVRVRWAELLFERRKDADAKAQLDRAEEPLKEVEQYASGSVEAAEAAWCLGKLYVLRRDAPKAEQAFTRGVKIARQLGSKVWEEALISAWGVSAYTEAYQLYEKGVANARQYLKKAEAAAKDLEEFSKTQAAWLRVQTTRLGGQMTGKVDRDALLKEIAAGIAAAGPQDRLYHLRLLVDRGFLHTEKQEWAEAYRSAKEAIELGQTVSGEVVARGNAWGIAGSARAQMMGGGAAAKEEALADLRSAVAILPNNAGAIWKVWLAWLLKTNHPEGIREKANALEEASRNIDEAVRDLSRAGGFGKWAGDEQGKIDQLVPTALRTALGKYADDASAWKWRWRLASVLLRKGDAASKREAADLAVEATEPTFRVFAGLCLAQ
ncbi:MAG: protein kinase [Gemmataceae bacterium]|nr:protein kinase [Gemmataceae bacterium]